MRRSIEDLLNKQFADLQVAFSGHAAQMDSLLASHRMAVAQLILHESSHPFVQAVFESLRNTLRELAISERGTADAQEIRCLLGWLDKMESDILAGSR